MTTDEGKMGAGDSDEHAVIVHFEYGTTDLSNLFALEDELIEAVETAGVGEYDGHEIALDGSDGYYYLYGPDADALFSAIRPILMTTDLIKNPEVVLRYGRADDPNAREAIANLGTTSSLRQ